MKKPVNFTEVILWLANKLNGTQYAFRGTTSLVLQGLDMNVSDIDILTNKETALACNEIFKDYLVEKIEYKESDKFKSYYGKLKVKGVDIEIYGEWQIKDTKGKWSQPYNALERKELEVEEQSVYVTTVESELKMFAQMGRWNALSKIKRQVKDLNRLPLP